MVINGSRLGDMELPELRSSHANHDNGIISSDQFTRKNLKSILHLITAQLKRRGTKAPHIFLPFRSRIDDNNLERFLDSIFPGGRLIKDSDEKINEILASFDEFTIICGLKYLWSRLPNGEVIGWDVYLEFKRKEKEAGYPKLAFLSIMPKCLSSPAHASVVYDFLDLLVSIASNSQYNSLSGRKVAKMSSLWAFNMSDKNSRSAFYDATITKENNFVDGLTGWKESTDALFHLLLSFLRAMLPENELETLKLPKTLQSLLITNSYPPLDNTDSIKSNITIPCVSVRSTRISSNPYELISKVRHSLSFDRKDAFLSTENFTILKSIFESNSTSDIVSTLTEESRRVLNRLTEEPIKSNFNLYPGWLSPNLATKTDPDIPLFSEVSIQNVSIQDYYIWTWLSSLASDQPSSKKKMFGRSIVVEAGLRGLQKWLILTEEVISTEEYLSKFKNTQLKPEVPAKDKRVASNDSHKEMPLPPPPPPSKSNELLPIINFGEELKLAVEVGGEKIELDSSSFEQPSSDYKKYVRSLDLSDDQISQEFNQRVLLAPPLSESKRHNHRPPPPVLEIKKRSEQLPQSSPQPQAIQDNQLAPSHNVAPGTSPSPTRYSPIKNYQYYEPYANYDTKEDMEDKKFQKQAQDPYADYYVPGYDTPAAEQEPQFSPPQAFQSPPQAGKEPSSYAPRLISSQKPDLKAVADYTIEEDDIVNEYAGMPPDSPQGKFGPIDNSPGSLSPSSPGSPNNEKKKKKKKKNRKKDQMQVPISAELMEQFMKGNGPVPTFPFPPGVQPPMMKDQDGKDIPLPFLPGPIGADSSQMIDKDGKPLKMAFFPVPGMGMPPMQDKDGKPLQMPFFPIPGMEIPPMKDEDGNDIPPPFFPVPPMESPKKDKKKKKKKKEDQESSSHKEISNFELTPNTPQQNKGTDRYSGSYNLQQSPGPKERGLHHTSQQMASPLDKIKRKENEIEPHYQERMPTLEVYRNNSPTPNHGTSLDILPPALPSKSNSHSPTRHQHASPTLVNPAVSAATTDSRFIVANARTTAPDQALAALSPQHAFTSEQEKAGHPPTSRSPPGQYSQSHLGPTWKTAPAGRNYRSLSPIPQNTASPHISPPHANASQPYPHPNAATHPGRSPKPDAGSRYPQPVPAQVQAQPPAQPPAQIQPPAQAQPPAAAYPQYPPPAGYYPPPGAYYPPPAGYPAPPTSYPAPPAGYPPPPTGYPAPPTGYPVQPAGYPAAVGYPYYPYNYPPAPGARQHSPQPPKQTTSDITMMNMPSMGKQNKNKQANKANLRNALTQGSFGI